MVIISLRIILLNTFFSYALDETSSMLREMRLLVASVSKKCFIYLVEIDKDATY